MIDNPEKLVADHLRSVAAVRVVAEIPDNRATSWVRVTMLDAVDQTGDEYFHNYPCQLDCYAGADNGQPEVMALGRSVRSAMKAMPQYTFAGAVVTDVTFAGMLRRPDTDFTPDRQRVILTAQVWAHAVPV